MNRRYKDSFSPHLPPLIDARTALQADFDGDEIQVKDQRKLRRKKRLTSFTVQSPDIPLQTFHISHPARKRRFKAAEDPVKRKGDEGRGRRQRYEKQSHPSLILDVMKER